MAIKKDLPKSYPGTTVAGGSIIYSNPSGNKALENVYKELKKDPSKLDRSGFKDSIPVKGIHLKKAKKKSKKRDA